ncbi:hypothetical protein GJ744_011531 [Endocarpon pusillum]|uniref:Uncharacterized protein n=1 Tax=Endocarpon pusillum TaxID=364733 RepID=A0A8H7AF62_9EURO|nr:hypothetical protein GJ744_011531 [Endocarpon pusillum]
MTEFSATATVRLSPHATAYPPNRRKMRHFFNWSKFGTKGPLASASSTCTYRGHSAARGRDYFSYALGILLTRTSQPSNSTFYSMYFRMSMLFLTALTMRGISAAPAPSEAIDLTPDSLSALECYGPTCLRRAS